MAAVAADMAAAAVVDGGMAASVAGDNVQLHFNKKRLSGTSGVFFPRQKKIFALTAV
jgi:hypothetical protein